MENPASTNYAIHDLIRRRWSPRSFDDRPVEKDVISRILEAARWAPSCYNDQPWHFIVGRQDTDTYDCLFKCLYEGNQEWASQAPVLMLSVARTKFEHNGEENRHALHDVGLAVENLILQALDENLFAHQMAGFDREQANESFSIPPDHEPVAAIAMGYPDESEPSSEGDELKRSRKPQSEFVFSGEWGTPAEVLDDS